MMFFVGSILILAAGGILSLLTSSREKLSSALGLGSVFAASLLGLWAAVSALNAAHPLVWRAEWALPLASLHFKIDPLAAFFLVIIYAISMLATVYGAGYMKAFAHRRGLGVTRLWVNLLIAGMALVVTAANGILFIVVWEIMSLAAYFLVVFEDERSEVREAGLIYLMATHAGTGFLLVLFWLLAGHAGGSMDFDQFSHIGSVSALAKGVLFLLALLGFGAKAGFVPLHVWLPDAHPSAPSHVSAIMSGVMIKAGIYGILRVLTFLGPPPPWFGFVLVGIGLVSGILGVLFALAQHDLKRLLAYHSVENIGIIASGIGVGVLGLSFNSPAIAVLGFAGGLLHVLNHSIFKSLLFMGAGSVLHQTHSKEIDILGGLLKKMPVTGATFFTGSAAISGLPPLNGFVSEFFIYLACFVALTTLPAVNAPIFLAVILGLALIGGLAVACFTKVSGIIFLGESRSEAADRANESGWFMLSPMLILAGLCFVIGIFPFVVLPLLKPVIATASGLAPTQVSGVMADAWATFLSILKIVGSFLGLSLLLFAIRRRLLAGRVVGNEPTWGCGYPAPTARMQYTASSFVQPILDLGRSILQTRYRITRPQGIFPVKADLASHTEDTFVRRFYEPLFAGIARLFKLFQWMQHGHLQLYLLYMAVTLLLLLFWNRWG